MLPLNLTLPPQEQLQNNSVASLFVGAQIYRRK